MLPALAFGFAGRTASGPKLATKGKGRRTVFARSRHGAADRQGLDDANLERCDSIESSGGSSRNASPWGDTKRLTLSSLDRRDRLDRNAMRAETVQEPRAMVARFQREWQHD